MVYVEKMIFTIALEVKGIPQERGQNELLLLCAHYLFSWEELIHHCPECTRSDAFVTCPSDNVLLESPSSCNTDIVRFLNSLCISFLPGLQEPSIKFITIRLTASVNP